MLEIILGIAGVWILLVGKVPGWIVGKKGYEISGNKARVVGLILLLPIPVSFIGGVMLSLFFGTNAVSYGFLLELMVFILAMIIAMVFIRKFRVPTSSKQQQNSLS